MFTRDVVEGWLDYTRGVFRYAGLAVSTVHPWLTGRPGRIALAEAMLDYCMNTPGVMVATMAEFATYHAGSVNKGRFAESAAIPELPEK